MIKVRFRWALLQNIFNSNIEFWNIIKRKNFVTYCLLLCILVPFWKWEQILSFYNRPLFRRGANNIDRIAFLIMKTRLFKYRKFQIKILIIFLFLLKNVDCGYSLEPHHRSDSNEYPQSMFLSRNKKNNVYPCKHQFYYIKVGLKGVKTI